MGMMGNKRYYSKRQNDQGPNQSFRQSFPSQQVTLSYQPSDPVAALAYGNFNIASVGYTSTSVFGSIWT